MAMEAPMCSHHVGLFPNATALEVREQPDGSLYVSVGRLSQHLKGKEEAGPTADGNGEGRGGVM